MTKQTVSEAVNVITEYLNNLLKTEKTVELGCPVIANTIKEYSIICIDECKDKTIAIGVSFLVENCKYWSTEKYYFVKNGNVL